MAIPVFKATPKEKIEVQVGDEIVDLSRLSMGTLLDVVGLIGDDTDSVASNDLENIIAAMAAMCEPSNPAVTKEYLMGRDAFEEVIPFMKFAIGIIKEKMDTAGGMGLKNG